VANLETATRERFADLFRGWSVAVALSGSGLPLEDGTLLRSPDLRGPLGCRLLCGPRFDEMPLHNGRHDVQLAGTAVDYLLLHSPAPGRSGVTITAEPGTNLQVSLVRLPEHMARLSLRQEAGPTRGLVRVTVTAHDASVMLEAAAWERLAPTISFAKDTSYRPESPPEEAVRAWFGDPHLKTGETRMSAKVPLALGDGPWVLKMAGRDATGHVVTAWVLLDRGNPPR
jgi:hypothetical protein